MPANLPQPYLNAEADYRRATSSVEKVECLQKMLALLPKHKGTEKIQKDIKKRLAKLRQEDAKKGSRRGPTYLVEREGAGQITLIGPPNSGKSQILARLTRAKPDVSDYPFTTRVPQPGMLRFEDVHIQLVDTPPIAQEHPFNWLPEVIRYGDAVLLVLDLSADDLLDRSEELFAFLEQAQITLIPPEGDTPADRAHRHTLVAGNKADSDAASTNLEIYKEFFGDSLPIIPISALAEQAPGIDHLVRPLWEMLGKLRVYSKQPGKPADLRDPFVLARGSLLPDMARMVHKDVERNLKFARIWSEGRYDGQRVARDYELHDKDVIELHT